MTIKKLLKGLLLLTILLSVGIQFKPLNFKELSKHVTPFRYLKANNRIYGSGSYIKYNGKVFIITNRHVCNAIGLSSYIQVDSTINKIIARSSKYDLCLLETDKKDGLTVAKERANPLDDVTLIGFPRGIGKVIRHGAIIRDTMPCVGYGKGIVRCVPSTQISALAYPGNSGSPVLNSDGEVIGLLYAGSNTYVHAPYIVKHSQLIEFLEEYAK